MASKPTGIRLGHSTGRAAWPLAALLLVLGGLLALLAVHRSNRDQRAIDTDRRALDEDETFAAQYTAAFIADHAAEYAEFAGDKGAGDAAETPTVSDNAGVVIAVVDAATKEPIPHFRILAGTRMRSGFPDGLKEKNPGLDLADWQPDTLQVAENGASFWSRAECYDETMFRVEADGYEPQTTQWIRRPDSAKVVVLRLVADRGVSGRALQPDGQPAAGATVAIAMPGKHIELENGHIRGEAVPPKGESDRWRRPTLVKTDAEGRFRLPAETDPRALAVIVHQSGAVDISYADLRQEPEITLRPWGGIAGQVLWKDRAGAGEPIGLSIRRGPPGYPSVVGGTAQTHSDSEGKFVFEKVLPGPCQISRLIELPKGNDAALSGTSEKRIVSLGAEPEPMPTMFGMSGNQVVNAHAGPEPTPVLIGGQGRTVSGRLTGRDSWEGVSFTFAPNPPPMYWNRHEEGPAAVAYRLWRESPIGPIFFRDEQKLDADGSFTLAGVLPGDYQVTISAAGEPSTAGSFPISVNAERLGEAPAALDLGAIEVKLEPTTDVVLPDKFDGSEVIARVGPEVILAGDVLGDANRLMQRILERSLQPLSDWQIELTRKQCMSRVLNSLIEVKLAVVDARRRLPKGAWEGIQWQFNVQFAKEYLPQMIAAEGCDSLAELDAKLHEAGTSLEAQRRQIFESSFAQQWVDQKTKDHHEIIQEEAEQYYQAHRESYAAPPRARWKHLTVRFDKYGTNKEEARIVMADVHRQLKAGFEFGKVAEAGRDDVVIDDKADSWIDQGSLASEELDTALFTLPIGQLSEILEDERGVHILRVVERTEATITPFTDAEPEIRQKIEEERNLDRRVEYKANLLKTIPVWNLFKEAGIELEFKSLTKPGGLPGDETESPAAGETPTGEPKQAPDRWMLPELFRRKEPPK
jgi:hypothetical protein